MKTLEKTFKRKGYIYKQIKRTTEYAKNESRNDIALYEIYLGKELIGHEVFFIIKQKETDLKLGKAVVHYEAKETWPGDALWGKKGWSYNGDAESRQLAESKYLEAVEMQKSDAPKGKRGRPKKKVISGTVMTKTTSDIPKEKRGRGRPRKLSFF